MESAPGDQKAAPHALVITMGGTGHIIPILKLATELARRAITITFVSSESGLADGRVSDSSDLRSLDFRLVGLHMPAGPRYPRSKGLIAGYVSKRMREAFKPVMEKLLHDKSLGLAGPTCIIGDMLLSWTQDVADELQIPRYMFVSSGAIYARALQGFLPFFENGQFQFLETETGVKNLVGFDWSVCIPGLSPLRYHELPGGVREDPDEFRRRCEVMGQSAGIVVNSFFELEEKIIATLTNVRHYGSEHTKVPKIYPIGPLFSTSVWNARIIQNGLEDSASKCLPWLDSQPPSSVLYVAFGSYSSLTPEQIHELALGLEDSEQRFLWVIPQRKADNKEAPTRPPITNVLPQGFEARVGDRVCIVTGWAPQLQILAHSATGGFITHSGWNSTLESIVLGVPMISWPQGAEQHIVCRYVVDDLGIAEQLQTGPEKIPNRNEVERAVRHLMLESQRKAMRSRVRELKEKAAAAVADGGSQSRNYQRLVDDIRKLSPNPGTK